MDSDGIVVEDVPDDNSNQNVDVEQMVNTNAFAKLTSLSKIKN